MMKIQRVCNKGTRQYRAVPGRLRWIATNALVMIQRTRMTFEPCDNCGKPTGHRRAFGWGTFFAVVLTVGLWLVALPFYPPRCIICGNMISGWNDAIEWKGALKFTVVFVGLVGFWVVAVRVIPPTAPAILLAMLAALGSAAVAGRWSSSLR